MKKIVLMSILMALVASVMAATPSSPKKTDGSQIQWLTSMEQAMRRAQAEDKPILLDFFNPS